jgi:hypothetical protein
MFMCPVCFYKEMPDPPADYNICPCCGTEFENDDELRTYAQLRAHWISRGARWFFHAPPPLWNPWEQLFTAGYAVPYSVGVTFAGSVNVVSVEQSTNEPLAKAA